jgi:hypothetical protein
MSRVKHCEEVARKVSTDDDDYYRALAGLLAGELRRLESSQPPEAPAINVESRDFYELCQRYRHSQEWFPHGLTPSRTFEDIKKYIRCGETPWKESYDDPTPQRLP